MNMADERFSKRFGHGPQGVDISVRDDAPPKVRSAILMIAQGELHLSPSLIRGVLCAALRQLPDPSNWSEYPNVWGECQALMDDCPWYRVYDFVEALYRKLATAQNSDKAHRWQDLLNEHFLEAGVGWKMVDGRLEIRGPESFEASVQLARQALDGAQLPTARQEIHEALQDLSRRPVADITGAIQHAMAALECTAREAAGDRKATLGEILRRYPDILPRPLDDAMAKFWGYASEMARHLREGRTPMREEAELAVGVAASACTYLAAKVKGRGR